MNIIANCKNYFGVKDALQYAWYQTIEDLDLKRSWNIQELFKQFDLIIRERNQVREFKFESISDESLTEKHESKRTGKKVSYKEFCDLREENFLNWLREPNARRREEMINKVLARRIVKAIKIYKSGEKDIPAFNDAQEDTTPVFEKEMLEDTETEEQGEEKENEEPERKRRKLDQESVTCDGKVYTIEDFFRKMGSAKKIRVRISNDEVEK